METDLNNITESYNFGEDQTLSNAGALRRITAFLIDNIVLFLFILFLLSGFFRYFNILKLLNGWAFTEFIFIITLFYECILTISESLWAGKTPGKYMLNIAVKNSEGNDPDFFQLVIRNLLRVTYLIPPLFIIPDLICYLIYSRRIGDIVADTRVVKLK